MNDRLHISNYLAGEKNLDVLHLQKIQKVY